VEPYDVLIIGGGWSGVATALEIHEHNTTSKDKVSFALIEAQDDRLGGRAYSFTENWTHDGKPQSTAFEHGAQYIGTTQTAIWGVVQKAIKDGLIAEDDLVDGYAARFPYKEQVMWVAGKRYQYDRDTCLFGIGGVPPDLGLWDLLGSLIFIDAVQAIEQAINVLEPYKSPKWVMAFDKMTLRDWIDSFALPPGASALMEVSVEAVISVEADEVSAFYFFWYCACNGGFLNEVNDEANGPQQFYLACGIDHLMKKLVEPFKDHITYGVKVAGIDWSGETVKVSTVDVDDEDEKVTLEAKRVVVAMSPASIKKVPMRPALPPPWQQVIGQKMGLTLKCEVFYKQPWWRNYAPGKNGKPNKAAAAEREDVPQYTGYAGGANYPVGWVMDYSPAEKVPVSKTDADYEDIGCYCLMTFTIGDQGRRLQKLIKEAGGGGRTEQEITEEFVTTALAQLFNDPRALSTSAEFDFLKAYWWDSETPLIPGGPNTVFQTGVLTGADAPAKAFNVPLADKIYIAASEIALTPDEDRTAPSPAFTPNWEDLGTTGVYSDWRQSVGYMDGAIVGGRYVARQILRAMGAMPKVPLGERFTIFSEEVAEDAFVDFENLFADPNVAGPKVSQDQVVEVLTTLCQGLYDGSALDIAAWMKDGWENDAAALQDWVTNVFVEALVEAGLVGLPPKPPKLPTTKPVAEIYMLRLAEWSGGFLAAATAFVQAGYKHYTAYTPSPYAYTPKKKSDVVQLTSVAEALVALKSAEPYTQAAVTEPIRSRPAARCGPKKN